jgi:hypothetical protein
VARQWLIAAIAVLVPAVILPLVLFGIGDEEAEEEPAPRSARVIDEVRGTYRGVGIGDSAAEVRRVFGPREDAGDGPFTPLGAGSFAEVGGAMFIASPGMIPHTPRDPELLRYRDVSFLLLDERVFALMITANGAATQEGLAIGHDLDGAGERYDALNCKDAEIGDFGETFPFCAGRVAPQRHIWFGQDPIRSITITRTGFGSYECPRERRLEWLRRGLGPPRRCP